MITKEQVEQNILKDSRWRVLSFEPLVKFGSKYQYAMTCLAEIEQSELYANGLSLNSVFDIPAIYRLKHYDDLVNKNKELIQLLSDIKKPLVRLINDEFL